ncbi:hypothetical protein SK3146_03589 [Paenibacillus konkukensis]|uniref:Uncharacterized protein n=1 Tax=Paenibacillus konkukensis TaxID=2020716 RepID=A0ABY4RS44_9BACL|nr:hypothetical protein [Paenibacillus konkukensis]UQZ84343.1 hypothetical protein SK3146_03589 [Paenibacillus konkukensis]
MKKAIYIILFLVVTLGIGGYAASNYIISYFLQSMVSSETANMLEAAAGSSVPEQESKAPATEQARQNNTSTAGSSSKSVPTDPGDGPVQLEEEPNASGGGGASQNKQGTKSDISEKSGQEMDTTEGMKYKPEVSSDKAKAVEQSITAKEKAQILSVLIRKLSTDELQLFVKMASNGISVEEKKEAKKIILQKLTEEEYDQLISIAAKYGLSQGKSYKESKKE